MIEILFLGFKIWFFGFSAPLTQDAKRQKFYSEAYEIEGSAEQWLYTERGNLLRQQLMCFSTGANHDQIMDRVVGLVKKYDKIDSSKVTETADFQKDLSLDSLDRVELVMAIEEEFSIEIPDEEADKLTCCADVAKFIASGAGSKTAKS